MHHGVSPTHAHSLAEPLDDARSVKSLVGVPGAHVTSWTSSAGRELLFMSKQAILDGKKAIRGPQLRHAWSHSAQRCTHSDCCHCCRALKSLDWRLPPAVTPVSRSHSICVVSRRFHSGIYSVGGHAQVGFRSAGRSLGPGLPDRTSCLHRTALRGCGDRRFAVLFASFAARSRRFVWWLW